MPIGPRQFGPPIGLAKMLLVTVAEPVKFPMLAALLAPPPPLLPTKVLLLTVSVPVTTPMAPPPVVGAELLVKVQLVTVAVAELAFSFPVLKPPPPSRPSVFPELPLKVLLLTISVPEFPIPPPTPALLLAKVLLLTVSEPPDSLKMPPRLQLRSPRRYKRPR